MFSSRDMLAGAAASGAMAAATMTTADATPVKSYITFGNPNDSPQGCDQCQEFKEHQGSRSAESGDKGPIPIGIFAIAYLQLVGRHKRRNGVKS
jgi:hypothetical protein